MKRITIDPLTRLEGHGKVEIFLDEKGEVDETYLIVPDLRGFEGLCLGRPAEEMPRITNRICGLCPEAHHLASTKALDALYQVEPPPAARKLRELLYSAFFVSDHATHFFILAGPDFILGPDSPREERSLVGVFRKLGDGFTKKIVECLRRNKEVVELLGGRKMHPVAGLPGGWSKSLGEEERRKIEETARWNVDLALGFLKFFEETVLDREEYLNLIRSEAFTNRTYYMGTVDEKGRPNFYDGRIRVVGPDGEEFATYRPAEYAGHIKERVEPWTFVKLPFLKEVGWRGLRDGLKSGIYCASPLGRLNVAEGMATPRAQENYERMYDTLGRGKVRGRNQPVHYRLATHWARLIELLYAAERMLELSTDGEITDPNVRAPVSAAPSEGIGSVEAPRGTLIHHYRTDEEGMLTAVNLIVGTTNSHAAIALSIKKAARDLIRDGVVVSDGLLNRIEMVVRSYDPCFSCAAHAFPGGGGLTVTIRDRRGEPLRVLGGREREE
jgi:F420-non-reducing hydrogenase large subunit